MNDLDTLMESVTTPEMEVAERNAILSKASSPMSKSERIRRFLDKTPAARTREIVEALKEYGVTIADVGNVKSQLKRKAEKVKEKSVKTKQTTAAATVPARIAAPTATSQPEVSIDHSIKLDVLEAGIEFVRKAGGINEAQYTLTMIRRIKSL